MNLTQIFKGRVSQHILKKISNCSKPKSPKRPFGSRRPLFQVLFQNGNILRKPPVLDGASEGNGQKSELQWTGGGEVFVAAAWESLRFWRAPEGSSSTTSNSGSTSTTNMQLPIMNNSREHHQHQNAATLSIFWDGRQWIQCTPLKNTGKQGDCSFINTPLLPLAGIKTPIQFKISQQD